jgi:hypothetical protein
MSATSAFGTRHATTPPSHRGFLALLGSLSDVVAPLPTAAPCPSQQYPILPVSTASNSPFTQRIFTATMSHSINPIVDNIADSSPNTATDNTAMSHSINPTVDNITNAIATGMAPQPWKRTEEGRLHSTLLSPRPRSAPVRRKGRGRRVYGAAVCRLIYVCLMDKISVRGFAKD